MIALTLFILFVLTPMLMVIFTARAKNIAPALMVPPVSMVSIFLLWFLV